MFGAAIRTDSDPSRRRLPEAGLWAESRREPPRMSPPIVHRLPSLATSPLLLEPRHRASHLLRPQLPRYGSIERRSARRA